VGFDSYEKGKHTVEIGGYNVLFETSSGDVHCSEKSLFVKKSPKSYYFFAHCK
jgi:hypothetical protein